MLSGNWDLVADIVPSFKIPSKNEQQIKLCVKQQKYLEFIAEGDFKQALSTLRNEVTPVHDESKQLHFLASLLLSQNTEELKENIELECDRKKILQKVQNYIPASIMIPSSRLLVLTGQALEYQINTCEKHCGFFKADTLLEDHSCESFSLPDKPVNTITESMEVWNCVFSHSGDKLLVICKNICISIWEIPNCQKSLGVNIEVTAANWTVNDKQIVIGVIVGEIKIFDLNGCLINVLTGHDDQVTGVQFLQPGLLLSGGVDRRLILWEEGVKIKVIEQRVRQIEKAVNSNVVAVLNASKNEVTVFKFMPLEKVINIVEDDSITSIQVNMNGTQIITVVSMTSPVRNI
jgi:WD repeat-containing protein 26